jgi:Tfp pilus assembly protein PilF
MAYHEMVQGLDPSALPELAIGELTMSRTFVLRLLLVCSLIATTATLFTGCSRDPEVRKQKYFESGSRYFDKGKYREAAIQYSNALQVDSRFAQAHYQLGQTYLKLHDWNRAFQELSR